MNGERALGLAQGLPPPQFPNYFCYCLGSIVISAWRFQSNAVAKEIAKLLFDPLVPLLLNPCSTRAPFPLRKDVFPNHRTIHHRRPVHHDVAVYHGNHVDIVHEDHHGYERHGGHHRGHH